MAFTIKMAKAKKKGKGARNLPHQICDGQHCVSISGHCIHAGCEELLQLQLYDLNNENLSLSLAVDIRSEADTKLYNGCGSVQWTREESKMYHQAIACIATDTSPTTPDCHCTFCKIHTAREEAIVWRKKLAAAETRLDLLRTYQAANDKDAVDTAAENRYADVLGLAALRYAVTDLT
ncbi:hypothetical protein BAUCODRAFT_468841 [Baudoinia panamericana UAMH 10762]|uniref:Uncharacterized protein n=1 Tax=Baudoinia panamericana (strain UAMH 10762) TaxID=717646 RepID=M2LPD9_BAUPA|nr:uncharacterized protein BAUCODRAFT_468841 [Baudoinia panamericana UAMH 10762]EMC96257.1 hypothetical protein BAUCODRAFT_468841 [Baudoinia panamericana UAMH 10762]